MEFIKIVIYLSIYIGLIATSFYILSFIAGTRKARKIYPEKELPFVSVIIPAYNEEKSVARTFDSILASNYPKDKFEVIFVDDGSKDSTLKVARSYGDERIRIFTKPNGGKGSALNYGLKHAKGEIMLSMDADTFVEPQSMRNMIHYFTNPMVMAVTPAMLVHNPRTVWQKIQHVEYLLGIFLRKAFASVNSVYITPGAFSAYRKVFFDKYGGYDEKNVTEDIELSLRIQFNGYYVENSPDSPVYTMTPSNFKAFFTQRRRWYFGFIKNITKYRGLISRKYGDLGMFVIPIALISTTFAVFIITYMVFNSLFKAWDQVLFFQRVDFNPAGIFEINMHVIERAFFLFFTSPVVLFIFVFFFLMLAYIYYAFKKGGKISGVFVDLILFFLLFSIIYGLFWTISIIYSFFKKSVKWR